MDILYIHQHFSTPQGSTGTRSYEFAKKLTQAGHKVTMVCGRNQMANSGASSDYVKNIRKTTVEGFEVIEINVPYSNHDNFWSRVKKFCYFSCKSSQLSLTRKYDLIFCTTTPLTVGIPGILAKVFRRKKFMFEVRDLWPELPKAMGAIKNPVILGLMGLLEKISYKSADHLIGLSPGIVEGIKKVAPKKKVALIPNGCDIDFFSNVTPLDSLDGFSKTDFVAVFTGAHGPANGLNAVLDVAKYLKVKNECDIKFLFVGDGKEKPDLVKRSESEGLDNCIFWSPLPKTELARVLKTVDLGLMILKNIPAFYYGTSPNKFFDYIASGLPVLNNYPGWLAGLIQEHKCGVAVEPGDPKAFADKLIELKNNRGELPFMHNNAQILANKFNREDLAGNFVKVIEQVGGSK
jgi:glycosyltransferase involved in cell wall biosynthesis